MHHFVSNFNLRFLPQGLALYRSMVRHIDEFMFWVVCMDQECFDALQKLSLPFICPINFAAQETEAYKALRAQRTIAEYCWTVNPLNPKLVFLADKSVSEVTYIDADMWFLHSPESIFEEFKHSGRSALLTEHGYLPQYDQSNTSGHYCAQWITYRRKDAEPMRRWWEERCFEWCFHRYENGKFGDQKYLEQWQALFPDQVHVLRNPRLILAPWNAEDGRLNEAIAHHFHGLRVVDQNHYCLKAGYQVSDQMELTVYQPYLQDLRQSFVQMQSIDLPLLSQISETWEDKTPLVKSFLLEQMRRSDHLSLKQFNFIESE